jgi:hypothetical protein
MQENCQNNLYDFLFIIQCSKPDCKM